MREILAPPDTGGHAATLQSVGGGAKRGTQLTEYRSEAKQPGARATEQRSESDPRRGLVTCAKTVRVSENAGQSAKIKPSRFSFPTAEECSAGASSVGSWNWSGREGAVPQLEVYPGLVRLTAPDLNRREKTANRHADSPLIVSLDGDVNENEARQIRGWSRRSRARMVATMAELDLAPLLMQGDSPAMVTLTYPGDWETVAGDGETVKKHLTSFFKRFERAWGTPWQGIWKLEFQRRGAAHFHLLMVPPKGQASATRWAEHQAKLAIAEQTGGVRPRWNSTPGDGDEFRGWLSKAWADIVGHPDPVQRELHEKAGTAVDYAEGDRARDPKRAAVYFGKHGSFAAKDYQQDVPELWKESGKTVGRFWGYRGLKKVSGAATISFDQMLLLGRTLRKFGTRTKVYDPETRTHFVRPVLVSSYRWRVAKTWTTPAGVTIVTKWRKRKTTVKARRMTGKNSAGFLLVNDGPQMARNLARVLASCGESAAKSVPPVGMRGSLRERELAG